LYAFWLLEVIARRALGMKSNSLGGHGHGHSHDVYLDFESIK